jgi:hypothetical protein
MTHNERIAILNQPGSLDENINELYSQDLDITLQELSSLTGKTVKQLKVILMGENNV